MRFTDANWKAMQDCVARHIADGNITGAVTGVLQDGNLRIDAQGVSDADPQFALHTDTIFPVFSMTKPVTAACALQLVAEGRIGLSDPVSRYIPEFAQPRMVRTLRSGAPSLAHHDTHGDGEARPQPVYDYAPLSRALTVHDFLSFTSGLQTIMVPNPDLPPVLPTDSIGSWVARLGTVPLEFEPGTQWHYSNTTCYEVIARIIEIVSGTDFASFARERLFEPLGMEDTGFGLPADKAGRVTPLPPMFAGAPILRNDYASGSAGIFSSLADYAAFAGLLLNSGQAAGRRVLDPSVVERMQRPQIGDLPFPGVRAVQYAAPAPHAASGFTYGYGVAVLQDPARSDTTLPAGSYGWDGIGTRRLWIVPEKGLALVLFATGVGPVADPLQRDLEAIIATGGEEEK